MTNNWIEHNGGPRPVGEDVLVSMRLRGGQVRSPRIKWEHCGGPGDVVAYRILNQHLIDAKQAEIDALQHEVMWLHNALEQTEEAVVYGYTLLDDMDAKIDAARLEGIRLGLEAAEKAVGAGRWRWSTWDNHPRLSQWAKSLQSAYEHCEFLIRNLNPDTIAKEAGQ